MNIATQLNDLPSVTEKEPNNVIKPTGKDHAGHSYSFGNKVGLTLLIASVAIFTFGALSAVLVYGSFIVLPPELAAIFLTTEAFSFSIGGYELGLGALAFTGFELGLMVSGTTAMISGIAGFVLFSKKGHIKTNTPPPPPIPKKSALKKSEKERTAQLSKITGNSLLSAKKKLSKTETSKKKKRVRFRDSLIDLHCTAKKQEPCKPQAKPVLHQTHAILTPAQTNTPTKPTHNPATETPSKQKKKKEKTGLDPIKDFPKPLPNNILGGIRQGKPLNVIDKKHLDKPLALETSNLGSALGAVAKGTVLARAASFNQPVKRNNSYIIRQTEVLEVKKGQTIAVSIPVTVHVDGMDFEQDFED